MNIIGIDFGTTNSVVAKFASGAPEVLPIDAPKDAAWADLGFDRLLPSVYSQREDGAPRFGWSAKLDTSRDRFEAVKRLLRDGDRVEFQGETFLVEEIASMLFGAIKQGASNFGVDIDRAVVTVPANSRGLARVRTKICAGLVGIDVPLLINEPTAAAMAYGLHATTDQNVLVVDWGGGTLDVTLLMCADHVFVEQASKGVSTLGGIDIDKVMLRQLRADVPDESTWTSEENRAAMLDVELAKIRLSDHEDTSFALPRGQMKKVTRRRLNEWIAPLIERALVPVRTVMAEGEATGVTVDSLVLVGGTCKIPAVRDAITDLVGLEPVTIGVDPMTAVAEGAAIAAAILDDQFDGDFFVGLEHALGTSTFDPDHGTSEFSTILPRNMKLPAQNSRTYVPIVDGQESVLIRVIEGDPEKAIGDDDNVELASFPVTLTPRPSSEAQIELEYAYDVSGIIHVKATDTVDGSALLDAPIQSIIGRDPGTLVGAAKRVDATLSRTQSQADTVQPELSAAAQELIDRAETKVQPFVPDDESAVIADLVAGVRRAAETGDYAAELSALEAALRPYAYLYQF